MTKKTVSFNNKGIDKLPDNKPVVYKIFTDGDKNNYTGIAMRGRGQERLKEHLPGGKDYIPGVKVQIEQMGNIKEAAAKAELFLELNLPTMKKENNIQTALYLCGVSASFILFKV